MSAMKTYTATSRWWPSAGKVPCSRCGIGLSRDAKSSTSKLCKDCLYDPMFKKKEIEQ